MLITRPNPAAGRRNGMLMDGELAMIIADAISSLHEWADAVVAREMEITDPPPPYAAPGIFFSPTTGISGEWYVDGPEVDVFIDD